MFKNKSLTYFALILFLIGCSPKAKIGESTSLQAIKIDIMTLASDEMEGREIGTKGEKKAADYIISRFKNIGLKPGGEGNSFIQAFKRKLSNNPHGDDNGAGQEITGNNIIGIINNNAKETVVIGAHYDHLGYGDFGSLHTGTKEIHNGADDNASGTVGLLELSRMLRGKELKNRIDLIAYTLEEPPFFRTDYMGSAIHAKSIEPAKDQVLGMISLEMIGYFSDKKNSQEYPLGILKWFYGGKGNYITLVQKNTAGKFVKQFIKKYKKTKQVTAKKFAAPRSLPGIDFSIISVGVFVGGLPSFAPV
jgi:Zn-dependent M28 family amino/carboxypeptidase